MSVNILGTSISRVSIETWQEKSLSCRRCGGNEGEGGRESVLRRGWAFGRSGSYAAELQELLVLGVVTAPAKVQLGVYSDSGPSL
jgi:hypothetical protein